jgi:hypothetical protein
VSRATAVVSTSPVPVEYGICFFSIENVTSQTWKKNPKHQANWTHNLWGNWASDIWIHQDLNPLEVALKARADWETKHPKNSAPPTLN